LLFRHASLPPPVKSCRKSLTYPAFL